MKIILSWSHWKYLFFFFFFCNPDPGFSGSLLLCCLNESKNLEILTIEICLLFTAVRKKKKHYKNLSCYLPKALLPFYFILAKTCMQNCSQMIQNPIQALLINSVFRSGTQQHSWDLNSQDFSHEIKALISSYMHPTVRSFLVQASPNCLQSLIYCGLHSFVHSFISLKGRSEFVEGLRTPGRQKGLHLG